MSRMSIGGVVGLVLGGALAFLAVTAVYHHSEPKVYDWLFGSVAAIPGGIMGTATGVVVEAVVRFLVDRKAKPVDPP